MIRVLIAGGGTGGHLMPALALADAFRAEASEVEPVLVGAERGVEASILPTRSFRYHLLPVEPLYRRAWWRNLRWPLIAARVLRSGARLLKAEQPAVVVGTGGYAAGPILWQAERSGVPVVLQEQNAFPGLTTRWLAGRARQLHLGYPEARLHLRPGRRTEVCQYGNPIAPPPDPRPDTPEAKARLGLPSDRPVTLVMGGSQGARAVNAALAGALRGGALERHSVLWSTGPAMYEEFRVLHRERECLVRPFWDPVAEAYAAADLVVARAGAMTTAELCAWGLPSVLIPLPSAAGGHQARNAEALARADAAVHLSQDRLGVDSLVAVIRRLLDSPAERSRMATAARARGHPKAAQNIARHILSLVS